MLILIAILNLFELWLFWSFSNELRPPQKCKPEDSQLDSQGPELDYNQYSLEGNNWLNEEPKDDSKI